MQITPSRSGGAPPGGPGQNTRSKRILTQLRRSTGYQNVPRDGSIFQSFMYNANYLDLRLCFAHWNLFSMDFHGLPANFCFPQQFL